MRLRLAASAIVVAIVGTTMIGVSGRTAPPGQPPDGNPNLEGVWQALNTASWDLRDHPASLGVPAGQGVVVGKEIPYQPWAAVQQKENFEKRATADPETNCLLPGVPRITYMPFPFQIAQTADEVTFLYEYVGAFRVVSTTGTRPERPLPSYMGDSRGRWDGNTLVVDVTKFNGDTWFDRAGNFHSDALHVVERYTPMGPDHLMYEVTIEDPTVFTQPWKIAMPLYRRKEPDIQTLEYECAAYAFEEKYLRNSTQSAR